MDNILIVEDDAAISDLIRLNLTVAGYRTSQAANGMEAQSILERERIALMLLDVMLPDIEGFAFLEKVRDNGVPVIFLTARSSLADKVKGLKMGAEDYIVKPFEAMELLARIEVVLRRYDSGRRIIRSEDVEIDTDERTVKKGDAPVELTMKEYELLLLFLRNRNKAMSREKMLELVWGYDYAGETRTVDIHVQKLRKKLDWEERIRTVYKFGYRLEDHP